MALIVKNTNLITLYDSKTNIELNDCIALVKGDANSIFRSARSSEFYNVWYLWTEDHKDDVLYKNDIGSVIVGEVMYGDLLILHDSEHELKGLKDNDIILSYNDFLYKFKTYTLSIIDLINKFNKSSYNSINNLDSTSTNEIINTSENNTEISNEHKEYDMIEDSEEEAKKRKSITLYEIPELTFKYSDYSWYLFNPDEQLEGFYEGPEYKSFIHLFHKNINVEKYIEDKYIILHTDEENSIQIVIEKTYYKSFLNHTYTYLLNNELYEYCDIIDKKLKNL